jgi:ABC-type transport system involved in multi-copper enzyme maturation permease subunit
VKTILLIAADSVRALLHQRLLLGLMLIALALITVFSFILIGERKATTMAIADQSAADASVESGAGSANAGAPAEAAKAKPNPYSHMSKEDRKKLADQMDQASSVLQAVFYQVASFGGSLVSLFIFGTAVATEIRKGTIRITLTKPVSRTQYLLGKYFGGVVVMAGYAIIASLAIVLFVRFVGMDLSPASTYAPWMMFCRQLMLGSLAMLLSLFVHPFVACVLAFFAGNGYYSTNNLLFFLLPNYSSFNLFNQMFAGTLVNGRDVFVLTLYAADFVVLMLLLALWRFRSKELV